MMIFISGDATVAGEAINTKGRYSLVNINFYSHQYNFVSWQIRDCIAAIVRRDTVRSRVYFPYKLAARIPTESRIVFW